MATVAKLPVGGSERELAGHAAAHSSDAQGPPTELTAVTWQARGELEFDHWEQQGRWLGAVGRGCGWWIGDWLRYGNARYGEKYRAAARITGYDTQSLMNMVYVASRVEPSRRRENLAFSHHAELAALPAQEQEKWLDRIETERLSVRALRSALRGAEPAPAEPAAPERTCPEQAPPGAKNAPSGARAVGEAAEAGSEAPKAGVARVVCPNCGYRLASSDMERSRLEASV